MNKKLTIILGISALVIAVLAYFPISAYIKLQAASSLDKISLSASDFKEVQTHCPTNIELQPVCLRSYYTSENDKTIEADLIYGLQEAKYIYKKLNKGYDGGSQIAYVAYNQIDDYSYVFVIQATSNTAYKKSMGNFRTETYPGKSKFNNYS